MSDLIEYVELRFVDVLGRLKAMTVPCKPAKNLEELSRDPILEQGTSLDGSSVAGLADVEHSDLRLEPDAGSLTELPYRRQRLAAAMCFIKSKVEPRRGKNHFRDSRGILHAVCERYLSGPMKSAESSESGHFLRRSTRRWTSSKRARLSAKLWEKRSSGPFWP